MKRLLVSLALVAATATTAAADYDPNRPDVTYANAGASLGVQRAIQAGLHVDGGYRVGTSPLFVRGELAGGASAQGTFRQVRAGLEARWCGAREVFCSFIGADVGYQRDHVIDTPWAWGGDSAVETYTIDAHDALLVPRTGVEMGRLVKFRAMVEMPMRAVLAHDMTATSDDRVGAGLAVKAGLGIAF